MVSRTNTLPNRSVITFGLRDVFPLCHEIHLDVEIIEYVFEKNAEFVIATNTFDKIVCLIVGTKNDV